MERLTPLVAGALAVLIAGCATAATDQPTRTASVSATQGASVEPAGASPPPSQVPAAASGSLPSPPTNISARSELPGEPGTMFIVRITWTPAATTNAHRIYKYETGEGPGYGTCVLDKTKAGLLVETEPGATIADVSLDSAVTGAGVRCLYVVAVNAAGESSETLAWRSSD